jgi:hypothetical protein
MSKGSISKKEIPTPEKGIRKKGKKKKEKTALLIFSRNKSDFFQTDNFTQYITLKLFVLIFRTTQGVFAEPKFENQ